MTQSLSQKGLVRASGGRQPPVLEVRRSPDMGLTPPARPSGTDSSCLHSLGIVADRSMPRLSENRSWPCTGLNDPTREDEVFPEPRPRQEHNGLGKVERYPRTCNP